jgi:hypothetical protein
MSASPNRIRTSNLPVDSARQLAALSVYPTFGFLVRRVPLRAGCSTNDPDTGASSLVVRLFCGSVGTLSKKEKAGPPRGNPATFSVRNGWLPGDPVGPRVAGLFADDRGPWLPSPLTSANYDVSSDGKRFLMLKPDDQDEGARQIVVVQNGFEELKKRKK